MRTRSYVWALLASLLFLGGVWWALGSEAQPDRDSVEQADEWRYNTLVPSEHGELADCVVCHRIDARGPERSAPSLWGIVDAPKGRSPWFGYSPALTATEGNWDRQAIDAYLDDPVGYLPGTSKTLPAIRDDEHRARILDALEELSGR